MFPPSTPACCRPARLCPRNTPVVTGPDRHRAILDEAPGRSAVVFIREIAEKSGRPRPAGTSWQKWRRAGDRRVAGIPLSGADPRGHLCRGVFQPRHPASAAVGEAAHWRSLARRSASSASGSAESERSECPADAHRRPTVDRRLLPAVLLDGILEAHHVGGPGQG